MARPSPTAENSNEAIQKQFDLPERKSKINTIFKMRESAPVYCLCQSTDIDRFMICCEKCDEWYHGDCVNIEEEEAIRVKKWYCPCCIGNYGLKIVYRIKKSSSKHVHKEKHKKKSKGSSNQIPFRCGKCSNCLRNEECGNKDRTFGQKFRPPKQTKHQVSETSTHARSERKENLPEPVVMMVETQCYGPGCVGVARQNSKYCSDQCGLALAKLRILEIIPRRLAERNTTPCVAEQIDGGKLRFVREKKEVVINTMKQLDLKEQNLGSLIARAKSVPIVDTKMEEPADDENKMYCVTCGWDIPVKSAIKHMELCFRKHEGQTVLVSAYKSPPELNMLCEHFDPSDKTFCKRLRYICPDHFKPKQPKENEVCGCPLIKTMSRSIFSGADKYCQQSKKKCDQHYNWDILAKADLDLDRLREWNKLSGLLEEEALLVKQMLGRSSALGVLLHSTSAA